VRVLHVHTDLVGGGIERMMTTLAANTRAAGVGICWCPANHLEPPQSEIEALESSGIVLHRIPLPFLSPLYPVRLARVISRVRPDVLHLHGASIGVVGSVVGRLARVPAIVYTEHLEHAQHAGWLRRGRERTAGLPHLTVFVSHRSYQEAVETGPLKSIAERSSVIHNGIDLSPYDVPDDELRRAQIRDELGIPPGTSAIGCVGLLWRAKGQEYLLRAAEQIRRRGRPVIVILVGSGADEPMLRKLTTELATVEAVRFAGWRGDVPRVLGALDIYVQPSVSEGFGLAVVEAAAAELPIVASKVGGIPEIIEDGRDGLLVPPGDPTALAAAIQELIDDPVRAQALAAKARRTAFERFSAEAMAAAYMELYEQLVSVSGRSMADGATCALNI